MPLIRIGARVKICNLLTSWKENEDLMTATRAMLADASIGPPSPGHSAGKNAVDDAAGVKSSPGNDATQEGDAK